MVHNYTNIYGMIHVIQGEEFFCTLTIALPSSNVYETASSVFDVLTSRALFMDLEFSQTGRYIITLHVSSTSEEYDFQVVSMVDVVTEKYIPPIIETTYHVEMTYVSKYDVIGGREAEFGVVLYNDVGFPQDVLVNNFMFYEGE